MHQIIRHIHLRGKRQTFQLLLLLFQSHLSFALYCSAMIGGERCGVGCRIRLHCAFETIHIIINCCCLCFFSLVLQVKNEWQQSIKTDARAANVFIEFVNGKPNCIGAYQFSRENIAINCIMTMCMTHEHTLRCRSEPICQFAI